MMDQWLTDEFLKSMYTLRHQKCRLGRDLSMGRRICEVLLDLLIAYTFATSSSHTGQSNAFLQ